MRQYRARMRARGMKQITLWVPDKDAPGFKEQLRKQLRNLDRKDEAEAAEFIEQAGDGYGDDQ